MDELFSL